MSDKDRYYTTQAPMPYNFGAEAKQPISNKHLESDRAKWANSQSKPKMSKEDYIEKYGLYDIKKGEVRRFRQSDGYTAIKKATVLYRIEGRGEKFDIRLSGDCIIVEGL